MGTGAGGGGAGQGGARSVCNQALQDPFSISIAGSWSFIPAGVGPTTIQVPGGGWLKQGVTASSATYQTQITVPDSGSAQTTLIEFGAINFQAMLSVDGSVVGTNTTAFTPSVFDVTKVVKRGQQHSISVAVKGRDALKTSAGKDTVPVAAGWSGNIAQGIFRSATVRVYPDVYISDVFVRTSVTDDTVAYDVSITNTGNASQQVTLSGILASWNCEALNYPSLPSSTVTVAAGATQTATVGPVKWGLGTTSYWWPNVPYQPGYRAKLHNLTASIAVGGKVTHSKQIRFGFRQVEQKRADPSHVYYYLNGTRVNFRGDNLQGANYDSINNGGKGDAYDTLPGFMPPSAQNPGWPQAVANYQRLNYNVNRIHQVPAAPYMLDVTDELGLMIIDETAIRGSDDAADFVAGHDNMVNHARALVLRDRNHPSVIRWSQSNEANNVSNDSVQFERDLYTAMNALDPTRPISADCSGASTPYDAITDANFSTFAHYQGGFGVYTEQVASRTDRPFGQGEFIWSADNTRQGLAWFGTATMAMRRQNASEIRPYTLLSSWASIIPGVTRTSMTIEQGGNPAFGTDNLPDPWSNPILMRVQRAFSPVLVADQAYWEMNKSSNSNGDWPTTIPALTKGAVSDRTLLIFNDTFAGTAVTLVWEVHADTATGTIASMGMLNVEVPLGSMVTQPLSITAPATGSKCYLVLRAQKAGVTLFEETAESFTLN